jgi:hypothetical protein
VSYRGRLVSGTGCARLEHGLYFEGAYANSANLVRAIPANRDSAYVSCPGDCDIMIYRRPPCFRALGGCTSFGSVIIGQAIKGASNQHLPYALGILVALNSAIATAVRTLVRLLG